MTVKVALLGTSHVAALWQGWRQVADLWPEVEISPFAAPGRSGLAAKLRGRKFGFFGKAAASARVFGHDGPVIDLSEHTHVVRVGRQFPEAALVPFLRRFAIDGITDPADAAERPSILSQRAAAEMIAAIARDTAPPAEWRDWDSPQLTILQVPYPDVRFATHQFAPGRISRQWLAGRQWLAQKPAEMKAVRRIFIDALTEAMAAHRIGFVEQVPQTMDDSGLSQMCYSEGSLRMEDGEHHKSSDYLHMNADFGALTMADLMTRLVGPPSQLTAQAASA